MLQKLSSPRIQPSTPQTLECEHYPPQICTLKWLFNESESLLPYLHMHYYLGVKMSLRHRSEVSLPPSKQLELCTWWWTSKTILIKLRSSFSGMPQSPPTQWSSTSVDFFSSIPLDGETTLMCGLDSTTSFVLQVSGYSPIIMESWHAC